MLKVVKGRRAQAVIETMIILATAIFILTFLVAMVYDQFDSYSTQLENKQASLAVSTLAKEIDDAYFLGPGTVKNIEIVIPKNTDFNKSFISGKAVVLRVRGSDFTSSTSATIRGVWPDSAGEYVFSITSFGDFVYVSQQEVMFSPASISQSVSQDYYADVNILATNISPLPKEYNIILSFPSNGSSGASASTTASSPITFTENASTVIPLRVACSRESFGSYTGFITFNPTDGSDYNLSVPINLVCVSSQPKLMVFPENLTIGYNPGSRQTASLLVCNMATSTLPSPVVSVSGGIIPFVFVSQISSIPANTCSTISLTSFVPSGSSSFSGKVSVSSGGITSYSDISLQYLFSPASVSSLALWVKADAIVGLNEGDSVSTWSDLSGNGNDFTQSTPSNRPTYRTGVLNGKPVLRTVASSQQRLNVATNFPAPVSIIYVGRFSGAQKGRLLSGLNSNWLLGFYVDGVDKAYFDGWVNNGSNDDTAWHIYTATIPGPGNNSSFYGNGSLIASNQSGVTGPNGLRTSGITWGSEIEFADGDIAEIIVYNKTLSATEQDLLEEYLASKYGITLTG